MTVDMIKKVKIVIFKKCQFMLRKCKKLQNLIFFENYCFCFFYNMYLQSYVFGQLQTIEAIACT